MMNEKKLIKILTELKEKSKDFKNGFLAPQECRVKLSELNNYDFFIFSELEKMDRLLWTKRNSNSDKIKEVFVPILKIENDFVSFIPRIIREYLKEIEI